MVISCPLEYGLIIVGDGHFCRIECCLAHNFPIDMRECERAGRTCAVMLSGADMGRSPWRVEVMLVPSGILTCIVVYAVFLCFDVCMSGYADVMK
jgi:hypothetical protein